MGKILVTGSSGHLGEALMRVLSDEGQGVVGLDIKPGPFTDVVGSIADADLVAQVMSGVDAVLHAATLHKPHAATHDRRDFIEVNVGGTQTLLDAAVAANVGAFVFTSTTSAFGAALTPAPGAPAAWIDETVTPVPRNIYGVTKCAAEDLCQLTHRTDGLPVVVLRVSRFFPEQDDNAQMRGAYADANLKATEFLFRRVDIADVVTAHLCALRHAASVGFGKYIISGATPFKPDDTSALAQDAPAVVAQYVPNFLEIYAQLGFRMFPHITRVYDSGKAQADLDWQPHHDFRSVLVQLAAGELIGSDLARKVGAKGYHETVFAEGPYPVE
ncbi:NAD(P)-dependent oxidoreductase [Actibacterium sp. 188UL27-1]|uniref:NAD-dependent epimerase/dehydratase family protein n=1 Tax=Actibacterium sp. 188UL27-1 TaxID=2786961 RepID=UPI00195622CE|nr:NAD(P)-dependent oxidoreductase [Actibacterium sp. 188UL27-1]MBM7066189.1 NAD(P)-dependent oxidoreductase [Actibacterium sp. 188UL27-1]